MKNYTWDDIFCRADGAVFGEPALKAKDEARWQVRGLAMERGYGDLDKEECPEEWVEEYCNKWNLVFDDRGNIINENV